MLQTGMICAAAGTTGFMSAHPDPDLANTYMLRVAAYDLLGDRN
jgi:hypothetical protein